MTREQGSLGLSKLLWVVGGIVLISLARSIGGKDVIVIFCTQAIGVLLIIWGVLSWLLFWGVQ
jgi:hypothetical protein